MSTAAAMAQTSVVRPLAAKMPSTSSPSTSEMTAAAASTRPTMSDRLFAPQCSGAPNISAAPVPMNSRSLQPLTSRPSHVSPFTVPSSAWVVKLRPPNTSAVTP